MDSDLDYEGYTRADQVRPKSRHILHKQIDKYNLIDIYREMHPSGTEKTWRQWNKSRKMADKEARLDYFLVDTAMASYVELVGVSNAFTSTFDHRPVLLKLDFNKIQRGPGYWKFNNSMLDELDFCKKVRDTIARVLFDYQMPDDPEKTPLEFNEILLMTPAQQSEISMSLNPHQLLEYLLFAIKGVARRYGQQKKTDLMSRKGRIETKLMEKTRRHDVLLSEYRAGQIAKTADDLMQIKTDIKMLQKNLQDIDNHMN